MPIVKRLEKFTDRGLAALIVYQCGIEVIDRIELFSGETFYADVPHLDFQIIHDSYEDPAASISDIKEFVKSLRAVDALVLQAKASGAWQRVKSTHDRHKK